jgi:hypothetical protein
MLTLLGSEANVVLKRHRYPGALFGDTEVTKPVEVGGR